MFYLEDNNAFCGNYNLLYLEKCSFVWKQWFLYVMRMFFAHGNNGVCIWSAHAENNGVCIWSAHAENNGLYIWSAHAENNGPCV